MMLWKDARGQTLETLQEREAGAWAHVDMFSELLHL